MNTQTQKKNTGKTLHGVVVSTRMQDTAMVEVERYVKHPKYGKYVRRRKKYAAHDPENKHQVGEKVTITETRPLSKTKHFKIVSGT